jgi:putative PIN family toxin of toxin-antitoxin system
MRNRLVLVLDTNVFVSALLFSNSAPEKVLKHAVELADLMMSKSLFQELKETLTLKKFDHYLSTDERMQFLQILRSAVEFVEPQKKITMCRDEKDNHILELAIEIKASCIVTGDQDLLILNPFQNIPILRPREFLAFF